MPTSGFTCRLPLLRTPRSRGRLVLLAGGLALLSAGRLLAQTTPTSAAGVTLTGTVVAAGPAAEPLPFATVLLRRTAPDTALVATGQTTLSGSFSLPAVPAGAYRLRVLALGYRALSQPVRVAAAPAVRALGTLRLAAGSQQLGEVRVRGQRAVVQQELGKTVVNVDKDLASAGGTATDALQNVPSVAVDAAGVVSLRGSSNFTILVDGKPANLNNGGSGPQLSQVPAARLARIEVLTNPSAKYDAGGTSVINLITKQDYQPGWEGQATLQVGTPRRIVPSLSVSRRQGAATWSLNYGGRDALRQYTTFEGQTVSRPDGSRLYATQGGPGSVRVQQQSAELSLRYALQPEQTLTLSVTPQWEQQTEHTTQALTQQVVGAPGSLTQAGEQHLAQTTRGVVSAASYRRTWAAHAGRELTAAAGALGFTGPATVTQTLTGNGPASAFQQFRTYQAAQYFGQADYVRPTADSSGRLEAGFKVQANRYRSHADNQTTDQSGDSLRTFAFNFTEVLPAAYALYQRTLRRGWEAQAGLRAEYTYLQGAGSGSTLELHYLSLFPSATVARTLGPAATPGRLQLSYARRINRPFFMAQLPLPFYQDPRNYDVGNPELRPEFSHNLELGYERTLAGGATLTATVFGRFTENAIYQLRTVDSVATRKSTVGIVTASTYQNAGRTANLGLELTWAQPLTAWWRILATGSLYRSQLATNAGNAANQVTLAGTARLVSSFAPRPGLDVQLTGTYRSATLTAQGRLLPTGGLDLALRQRLLGERAALTLRVTDLLNTQVSNAEIATPVLQSSFHTKYVTRVGWLGFSYYFGTAKAPKKIGAAPTE